MSESRSSQLPPTSSKDQEEFFDTPNDDSTTALEIKEEQVKKDIENLSHQKMPKNQLMMLIFLGILGLGILILGVAQIRNTLILPWPKMFEEEKNSNLFTDLTEEEEILRLKSLDTDGDGLSDYEEIYIYKTSPYLVDTDGDGIDDKQEILQQTDPNCPAGQICFGFEEESTESTQIANSETADQIAQQPIPSADDLRVLLQTSSGLSAEQVALFSDDELVDFYLQILAENPQANQVEPSAVETVDEIYNLSVQEIRQLLIDQGIDEATVMKLTDEELQILYQEAFREASENN